MTQRWVSTVLGTIENTMSLAELEEVIRNVKARPDLNIFPHVYVLLENEYGYTRKDTTITAHIVGERQATDEEMAAQKD